jgi:ATP-dependent Clp protease adaptor protein ClpS
MPPIKVDTPTRTVTQSKTEDELAKLWHVTIFNDPVNLMPYVTMVIMRIFGYKREQAHEMMLAVHEKGKCIVWTGERELAEMYVEQLQGYQLYASLSEAS